MHNVRLRFRQHHIQIGKRSERESHGQLVCHMPVLITNPNNVHLGHLERFHHVGIGDLSTTNHGDFHISPTCRDACQPMTEVVPFCSVCSINVRTTATFLQCIADHSTETSPDDIRV